MWKCGFDQARDAKMSSERKPQGDKGGGEEAKEAFGRLCMGEWERNTVRSLGIRATWRTLVLTLLSSSKQSPDRT